MTTPMQQSNMRAAAAEHDGGIAHDGVRYSLSGSLVLRETFKNVMENSKGIENTNSGCCCCANHLVTRIRAPLLDKGVWQDALTQQEVDEAFDALDNAGRTVLRRNLHDYQCMVCIPIYGCWFSYNISKQNKQALLDFVNALQSTCQNLSTEQRQFSLVVEHDYYGAPEFVILLEVFDCPPPPGVAGHQSPIMANPVDHVSRMEYSKPPDFSQPIQPSAPPRNDLMK